MRCCSVYCRRLEHSKILTTICQRSWLDGFDPEDVIGHVVVACVLEDNSVAVLKFIPPEQ